VVDVKILSSTFCGDVKNIFTATRHVYQRRCAAREMKAIIQFQYGSPDVLTIEEVERPVIGDNEVIDYTRENFTRSEKPFDLIVDTAGTHSLLECRRALTERGTYVVVGAPSGRWLRGPDRFVKALVILGS
jgi:NADPH:quinone reductase-like Zn-dependent oxidoreductase